MSRPSNFRLLLDISKAMWAPVYHELSMEDFARLDALEYEEGIYVKEDDNLRVFAQFRARRPAPLPAKSTMWVTGEQVKSIHEEMLASFGGEPGILHPGHVEGYIDRARHSVVHGLDPFPTIFDKAGHIMWSILAGHPFADGNKRTALATAFVFLGLNGYALWARNQLDEVHFAIKVASGHHEVGAVSEWLRGRAGPLRVGYGNAAIAKALGGTHQRPKCFYCYRFLKVIGHRAACGNCEVGYEITARAVALATGREGKHVEVKLGLHKLGEGPGIVHAITKGQPSLFDFI